MSEKQITEADAGVWLDGALGWHNAYRVVDLAMAYGMEVSDGGLKLAELYRDGAPGVDEPMEELSRNATTYLQTLAPEGYVFVWDAGELSLMKEEETE